MGCCELVLGGGRIGNAGKRFCVQFLDELLEGLFSVRPNQEYVVLKSDVGPMAVLNSWVYVFCLKMAHEKVCV